MHRLPVALVLSLLLAATFSAAQNGAVPGGSAPAITALPLAFEPNRGQAPPAARYLARGGGYTILLRDDGADLLLGTAKGQGNGITVRLGLVGAQRPAIAAEQPLETRVNYLLGNDRSRWLTGLETFGRVRLRNVYPATDLVYYGDQGRLEYDFVVRPGGDPAALRFAVTGATPRLRRDGALVLAAGGRELVWQPPVAYQPAGAQRRPVRARYVLREGKIAFAVGPYDRRRQLVIDPALAYSTYFGGSNDDHAEAIAVDSSRNAYVAGETRSVDLPTTSGAFDRSCGSDGTCDGWDGPQSDAFVMKLNPAGTRVIYATYLGGNSFESALAIAVDSAGNAYVGGETFSDDFAASVHLGSGLANTSYGVAYVVKLNSTGSALVYGATLGGANGESGTAVTGLKVDSGGNAYLAGVTDASDFPTTAGAFQPDYGGAPGGTGGDAFVAKLNASGTALVWASYLGGSLRDTAEDLAIDGSGNMYVTGWTSSQDFPTTAGAYRTSLPSRSSVTPTSTFVTKVNAGGASLGYSTFFGGTTAWDIAYGIAVANGNAYITGIAQSSDFPTTSGAIQRTLKGISDAFVAKLNAAGSGLVYSTLLGGSSDERGTGIAVNAGGVAYATGVTYSSDFPTNSYSFQQLFGGTEDVYVTQLNATGTGFAFSSYLGGSAFENDQIKSRIALNGSNVFVSGSSASTDFPVTPDAAQKTNGGNFAFDAFVARVVPLCALNTTNLTVTICKPAAGATVSSPVEIMAGSWDSRKVRLMQVYIDGAKKYQARLASLDVRLPMTAGTHRVTVQAIDTAGAVFKATRYVTVK